MTTSNPSSGRLYLPIEVILLGLNNIPKWRYTVFRTALNTSVMFRHAVSPTISPSIAICGVSHREVTQPVGRGVVKIGSYHDAVGRQPMAGLQLDISLLSSSDTTVRLSPVKLGKSTIHRQYEEMISTRLVRNNFFRVNMLWPMWFAISFDCLQYVEYILTHNMNGDDEYRAMIPCYYAPGKKQKVKIA